MRRHVTKQVLVLTLPVGYSGYRGVVLCLLAAREGVVCASIAVGGIGRVAGRVT